MKLIKLKAYFYNHKIKEITKDNNPTVAEYLSNEWSVYRGVTFANLLKPNIQLEIKLFSTRSATFRHMKAIEEEKRKQNNYE